MDENETSKKKLCMINGILIFCDIQKNLSETNVIHF